MTFVVSVSILHFPISDCFSPSLHSLFLLSFLPCFCPVALPTPSLLFASLESLSRSVWNPFLVQFGIPFSFSLESLSRSVWNPFLVQFGIPFSFSLESLSRSVSLSVVVHLYRLFLFDCANIPCLPRMNQSVCSSPPPESRFA